MPAYVLSDAEIFDPARIETYAKAALPTIAKHGGRFLAQGQVPAYVAEGTWPEGHVFTIVEFPDMETARKWYASEEYQEALKLRTNAANMKIFFVDGRTFDGKPFA